MPSRSLQMSSVARAPARANASAFLLTPTPACALPVGDEPWKVSFCTAGGDELPSPEDRRAAPGARAPTLVKARAKASRQRARLTLFDLKMTVSSLLSSSKVVTRQMHFAPPTFSVEIMAERLRREGQSQTRVVSNSHGGAATGQRGARASTRPRRSHALVMYSIDSRCEAGR